MPRCESMVLSSGCRMRYLRSAAATYSPCGTMRTGGGGAGAGGCVLDNFVHEQRVVCAAENECVDVGVEAHDAFDALFDKVVGAWRVVLKVFDEWHPHGACERGDGDVGA